MKWCGGGTHIYSAPHITLPYRIASQVKSFQLRSLKNNRGNGSVQSHRVTVWTAYKQRERLKPEWTRCTRCFLGLSLWLRIPYRQRTGEDRTRCAGPFSTEALEETRCRLIEKSFKKHNEKVQLRKPHLPEKNSNVYPDVGHPCEDCKTSTFRL